MHDFCFSQSVNFRRPDLDHAIELNRLTKSVFRRTSFCARDGSREAPNRANSHY